MAGLLEKGDTHYRVSARWRRSYATMDGTGKISNAACQVGRKRQTRPCPIRSVDGVLIFHTLAVEPVGG